mmetsp:Transcript_2846/g.4900  ORF Transcript_2846/g.4900 Transcript_2846/m.4900 type:complete len:200 (-) Transcript_2846:1060-1659(-)
MVVAISLPASSYLLRAKRSWPSACCFAASSCCSKVATHSGEMTRPSAVRALCRTHCQSCEREISAVAASSINPWMGTQPTPRNQASMYCNATSRLPRRPFSVILPPRFFKDNRSAAVTTTSQRRMYSWLGWGMCLLKTSSAILTSSGCATHVPSCPASTSRVLSLRTFVIAAVLAAGSFLIGICAAIPPIAWTPRLWQV